jgi:hypothetical protein
MQYIWAAAGNAVTLSGVDFLDPAVADEPDARERGVRLEIRPIRRRRAGSIYASPDLHLEPAIVRVDLLESAPRAADRMHWHPGMRDGEPGDRLFDPTMAEEPRRWLEGFLAAIPTAAAEGLDAELGTSLRGDGPAIATAAAGIVDRAMQLLEEARQPWPPVTHDERGLATF